MRELLAQALLSAGRGGHGPGPPVCMGILRAAGPPFCPELREVGKPRAAPLLGLLGAELLPLPALSRGEEASHRHQRHGDPCHVRWDGSAQCQSSA